MRFIIEYFRPRADRPWVRPWALATPIAILLICLPLLRPVHHPGQASPDETLRLATISAIVEPIGDRVNTLAGRLALDPLTLKSFALPTAAQKHLLSVGHRVYSDQPPMLAFMLSGPYWLIRKMGYSLRDGTAWAPYLLTLLGTTLPAAAGAGLIYRMSRLFELRRPWRTGLAAAMVFGTGLVSYAVFLNPLVPAAVLSLGAAGCLVHLSAQPAPQRGMIWFALSGMCAAMATALEPHAGIFLILFAAAAPMLRLPTALRWVALLLFIVGATPPLFLHAAMTVPITGDLLPGTRHPELALHYDPTTPRRAAAVAAAMRRAAEPPANPVVATGPLSVAWRGITGIFSGLFGAHGLLVHFPIIAFAFAGLWYVLRGNWPPVVKGMAVAAATAILWMLEQFAVGRGPTNHTSFANPALVFFLPMLFYWTGAWVRRDHPRAVWFTAGILLAFSIAVSIIGAGDPTPPGGYDSYTPLAALHHWFDPPVVADPVLAGG